MAPGPVARRLIVGSSRFFLCALAAAWASPACYSGSNSGTAPPPSNFYYPVGLAVSPGGNVLYVANSDFDLQWNGGTLQSYDLFTIRWHTAALIAHNEGVGLRDGMGNLLWESIKFVHTPPTDGVGCLDIVNSQAPVTGSNTRVPLSQACSPPVDSSNSLYFKGTAVIGAFATDLQLSLDGKRLFAPVRGDGTVTWAQVTNLDDATKIPSDAQDSQFNPFAFDCGQDPNVAGSRCDSIHHTGNDPTELGDTRNATMPGEPFGIAQTQDGTAMAVTHQATGETSLLLTGTGGAAPPSCPNAQEPGANGVPLNPSMQFVLEGMPSGGIGIAAVPHDDDAVVRCEKNNDQTPCVRQAFLETSRLSAEVDLLRYFDDDGSCLRSPLGSSLHRPFLERERAYGIVTNSPGTDSRGIVIDPTPSLLCKARLKLQSPSEACPESHAPGQAASAKCVACGQKPSRVFIASRSPPSVIYGQIGQLSTTGDGTFDPDQLVLQGNVPLLAGPSRIYLAPIVDPSGHLSLRLFVVCYDSAAIFVFKPDDISNLGPLAVPEAVMYVGAGPFAMAFDPFTGKDAGSDPLAGFKNVAAQEADAEISGTNKVLFDQRPDRSLNLQTSLQLRTYRFGYVASFLNSYLQVIDLDQSLKTPAGTPNEQTFEQVVFTLGQITPPKGT